MESASTESGRIDRAIQSRESKWSAPEAAAMNKNPMIQEHQRVRQVSVEWRGVIMGGWTKVTSSHG